MNALYNCALHPTLAKHEPAWSRDMTKDSLGCSFGHDNSLKLSPEDATNHILGRRHRE